MQNLFLSRKVRDSQDYWKESCVWGENRFLGLFYNFFCILLFINCCKEYLGGVYDLCYYF